MMQEVAITILSKVRGGEGELLQPLTLAQYKDKLATPKPLPPSPKTDEEILAESMAIHAQIHQRKAGER